MADQQGTPMICPACGSVEIRACGKRYALYPLAWVMIISTLLAQIHQLSAPFDYRCNACGKDFFRRTRLGRAAWFVFWVLLGGFILLLVAVALLLVLYLVLSVLIK
jgi:predicted RNA-binding Zn-ribbon protein involved in translation (DUF1610 family)